MPDELPFQSISRQLMAAASSGDVDKIGAVFASDGTVWHNITGKTCSASEAGAMFSAMATHIKNLGYEDIRFTPFDNGVCATTSAGRGCGSGSLERARVHRLRSTRRRDQ
jgi:hypothetical protein